MPLNSNKQELIESYYQSPESLLIALQHELNINRGYRKLLIGIFYATIVMAFILLFIAGASLWISIIAGREAKNSREFLEVNKEAIVSRIDQTKQNIGELKLYVSELHKNQVATHGRMKALDDMHIRLADAEIDLQVITALIKALKSGEVSLKAGVDDNGIRNFRAQIPQPNRTVP